MTTMFDNVFTAESLPTTEAEKQALLGRLRDRALYILEYNHNKNGACPDCIQRIMVREMNEILDDLWPLDEDRRAGVAYDGMTGRYTIHFENC